MAKADEFKLKRLLKDFELMDTDDGKELWSDIKSGSLTFNQAHRRMMNLLDAIHINRVR